MGVKSFLLYQQADRGAPPSAADVERLEAALEKLCARPVGKAKTTEGSCYILKQQSTRAIDPQVVTKPEVLQEVWLLQLAQAPARSYMLQRHAHNITEADAQLRTFLERRLAYKPKPAVPITLQGRTWVLGDGDSDFTVKLLQLGLVNQAPLALALEVEYAPVHHLDVGAPMLDAFVAAIHAAFGPEGTTRLEAVRPAYVAFKEQLPDAYGPLHCAVAYGELVTLVLGRGRQQPKREDQQG